MKRSSLDLASQEVRDLKFDVGVLVDLLENTADTDLEYFLRRYLDASQNRLETVINLLEEAMAPSPAKPTKGGAK